jgi:hypothetical protein
MENAVTAIVNKKLTPAERRGVEKVIEHVKLRMRQVDYYADCVCLNDLVDDLDESWLCGCVTCNRPGEFETLEERLAKAEARGFEAGVAKERAAVVAVLKRREEAELSAYAAFAKKKPSMPDEHPGVIRTGAFEDVREEIERGEHVPDAGEGENG